MDRNIIILFGGTSNERFVSTASAQYMLAAINSSIIWFWGLNNKIYNIKEEDLLSHKDPFIKEFKPIDNPIFESIEEAISSPKALNKIFLLAVHGGFGEDGGLQDLLIKNKRFFTGSDAKASSKAFNKIESKKIMQDHQIRTAESIWVRPNTDFEEKILEFFQKKGPCVAKPVCGGSSLGTVFIKNKEDIKDAYLYIKRSKDDYLIEKMIKGREITVGVIENFEGLKALPCTEIILEEKRNFDYEGKYLGQGSLEKTPADLSSSLSLSCQRVAIAAHAALGLYGYSRTDMILDEEGPVFLETNTLPGLSKSSLIPKQLNEAQITMRQFLNMQIELAKKLRF